ncbi:MAG: GGDEF domain-containing protein [Elusimicrobia bacterium]|nr:GGDEF domain-containing protein [Candidatus Obscuribacterium magneticum]
MWTGLAIVLIVIAVSLYLVKTFGKSLRASSPASRSVDPKVPPIPDYSIRDSVTGLYNDRHLMTRLRQYMARCNRENIQMALVIWDIDGFEKFNNQFGQEVGNRLLQAVGSTIKKSLRLYDEAFRAGRDEFCAVLIPADEDVAQDVAGRVGDVVSKSFFEGEAEYAHHRFSLASAHVFYSGAAGQSPEALLHEAYQALYRAQLADVGQ